MMSALHALFRSRHALPRIMQSEVNECGLACLAMLASYQGKLIDIVTLRSRFRLAASGPPYNICYRRRPAWSCKAGR